LQNAFKKGFRHETQQNSFSYCIQEPISIFASAAFF